MGRGVLPLLLIAFSACASQSDRETEHHHGGTRAEPAGEPGHDHGHGHDEEAEAHDRNALERLRDRRCEHEVPILGCDECRYEVGAVEVEPSLLDPEADDLIRTAKVSTRSRREALELTGEVAFDDRRVAHVSPRVGGVVREAFVTLGDRVERGDRLVSMDSLELGRLRSRYLQARARLDLAQKNSDRERRLHERRIASGREKLQAEVAHQEARIELASAREQLRLLGLPGGGGGATALRSPISGRVVDMHAVSGERVSPDRSVITVADLSEVWVWADLYERDLGALLAASNERGLSATVEVAAFPGRRFEGEVGYVGALMEESTRTVKVRVELDNTDELLRPGMFAEVSIELGESAAVLVPDDAVMRSEGRSFVFVRVGPRLFLRRDVVARPAGGGLVALLEGVDEGEEVVVRGAFLLKSDVLREQMGAGCAD